MNTTQTWTVESLNGRHTLFNESTGMALPVNGSMRTSIDAQRKASVQFVAHQLNSHAALLGALEEALEWIENSDDADADTTAITSYIQHAISLAKQP